MTRILILVILATLIPGTADRLSAQPSNDDRSHSLLPDGPSEGNLPDLLRERFNLRDQQIHDSERLRELLELYRENPNPEALQEYLRDNPISPEQLERLRSFAGDQLQSHELSKDFPIPNLDRFRNDIESIRPPDLEAGSLPGGPNSRNGERPIPRDRSRTEEEPIPENQRSRSLMEWAQRHGLDQSEAVRDVIGDLARGEFGDLSGESWPGAAEDLDWFKQEGNEFVEWVQIQANNREDWGLNFSIGEFGFGGGFGDGRLPSGGGSPPTAVEGSWLPVIVLVLFATLGLAAWWYLSRPERKPKNTSTVVTDWPISPDRIRSTDELIQAFEHLALSRIGETARTWHHHAVAAGLTFQDPAHQDSVTELTGLYALARYAPPDQPLTPEQVTAARRNLELLAGGAA